MFDREYGERRLYQLRTLLRAMDEGETVARLAYEAENEAIAVSVVAQLLDTDFETARICLEAGAIRYHAESRAKNLRRRSRN